MFCNFPKALDDAVMDSSEAYQKQIMQSLAFLKLKGLPKTPRPSGRRSRKKDRVGS